MPMLAGKKAAGDASPVADSERDRSQFESEVCEELRRFVASQYELELSELSGKQTFSELGVDSFSLLELVVFVERKYGIKFPLELLSPSNLSSISAFARCVAEFDRGLDSIANTRRS